MTTDRDPKKPKAPSLLDPEATGGETADVGFTFQDNMLVARIPFWLSQDGFTSFVSEALGDIEARFFVPGIGIVREFNECKDRRLTPALFWEEIERFRGLHAASPNAYRIFRLVCTGLSKEILSICRALDRLRRTFPFYDGVSEITDQSYLDFRDKVVAQKKCPEMATFLFSHVEVEWDAPSSAVGAHQLFRTALEEHFPECREAPGSAIMGARNEVAALVDKNSGTVIDRAQIEERLGHNVSTLDTSKFGQVSILTSSQEVPRHQAHHEIVFDWSAYSGGDGRSYPPSDDWNVLINGLSATRDWILNEKRPRRLQLTGQRRLSSSLAFGAAFPAVSGFAIDMDSRGNIWSTDRFAQPESPVFPWNHHRDDCGPHNEIAIVIAIKREIADDVRKHLAGELALARSLQSNEPLTSPEDVNRAVESAKRIISETIRETSARVVHLFMAVPSPFALFLGHRLNATCAIQAYEHLGATNYHPTARLSCS